MYYVEFISYFISFVIRAAKNGRDGAAFTVFLVGSEIVACAFVLCCVCEDFVSLLVLKELELGVVTTNKLVAGRLTN